MAFITFGLTFLNPRRIFQMEVLWTPAISPTLLLVRPLAFIHWSRVMAELVANPSTFVNSRGQHGH